MGLYIGSSKAMAICLAEKIYKIQSKIKGLLVTFDNRYLKDAKGIYLTTKEGQEIGS